MGGDTRRWGYKKMERSTPMGLGGTNRASAADSAKEVDVTNAT